MYLYLTTYKIYIIFLMREALVRDYYTPEILYYLFEHLNFIK
jgi:hypothetical protein